MVNIVGSTDDFSRWKPDNMQDHLTMTELCRKVGRTSTRIKVLEKQGRLPRPARVKVGALSVRLYSPEEVRTIKKHFASVQSGPIRKR